MTKKKKKRDFKYWIGKMHLWLGLASGIIVLFLSVTGCIFVFNEEISNWLRKDVLYVTEKAEKTLPVSQLWETTQQQIGERIKDASIVVYNNPDKAWTFRSYKRKDKPDSIFHFGNIEYYQTVYVNPYTGKVLGVYDETTDFFNIVKMLHWSLLLETEIGQPIIGWGTFTFVIMLITGIILWWPKNKAARKQRVWFQWKATTQWKRKNYDLHNILGFYIASIAIIIAFTGMVWAFTWFQAIVYVAGSGTTTPPDVKTEKSIVTKPGTISALDTTLQICREKYPSASAYNYGKPAGATDVINVYVQQVDGAYYINHNLQVDQYTGKLLSQRDHSAKNFGEKLITANYDIHVGAILGIPGKILAFIACFICGMLPVTGFLIWYGRNFKKK